MNVLVSLALLCAAITFCNCIYQDDFGIPMSTEKSKQIENKIANIIDKADLDCSRAMYGVEGSRCYRILTREVNELVTSKMVGNKLKLTNQDINAICCRRQLLYNCFLQETLQECKQRKIQRQVINILFSGLFNDKLPCRHLKEPMIKDQDQYKCESGWHKYKNKCFYFIEELATAKQAFDRCKILNAQMATIHSAEENEFIRSIARNKYLWIGAVQSSNQFHSFVWIDGSEFNYTNWFLSDPNIPSAHCVWAAYASTGNWGDELCATKFNILCERILGRKNAFVIDKFPENNIVNVLIVNQARLMNRIEQLENKFQFGKQSVDDGKQRDDRDYCELEGGQKDRPYLSKLNAVLSLAVNVID
ncbi:ladderlectin-like protein [Dinothrombium tinctorium]|uniref:Ladderlectin-like protein n=1 Tax=Dinothrombium tinctorium TaxID=1965070 RepID=A0A3S3P6D5_9ACAR|nr:ladderlectin-like protein [Dinothrombium tinctorium]